MTTAITKARPDDVLRAAVLLGGSADELGTAVSACRRSADVDWVGRPNEQYQAQLAGLATGLTGVRSAFDAACDALIDYARVLAGAQQAVEEADRLSASVFTHRAPHGQADDPTGAQQAALDRARELRIAAAQEEARAAQRLAQLLHDLADRAPRVSGWTTAGHHAANFVQGVGDALQGVGSTFLAAARSLPGVGTRAHRAEARGELVDSLEDAVQPWKQVRELYDELTSGHAWLASGQLAGALLFRFRGAHGKLVDRFGGHDGLPDNVLLALRRGGLPSVHDAQLDVWLASRLRQELVEALKAFENVPLPVLDDLLVNGVDLIHHEAAGGHTILKHVGRDPDFLRDRQLWEPWVDGEPTPMSSFANVDEAESLITTALRSHAAQLREFLADDALTSAKLVLPISEASGAVIDVRGAVAAAGQLVVRLKKVDGTVRVQTAFLDQ
ncbi:MAG: Bacterial CdiA-CT RNAse domain [Frankiales bacterium]|nr:Bacterial CdiA-CT RNAse domain [Frankiales bacterium]